MRNSKFALGGLADLNFDRGREMSWVFCLLVTVGGRPSQIRPRPATPGGNLANFIQNFQFYARAGAAAVYFGIGITSVRISRGA